LVFKSPFCFSYYALTPDGLLFLNELDGAWNELARTIGLLKGMAPQIEMK
jgi:hypothetical protein